MIPNEISDEFDEKLTLFDEDSKTNFVYCGPGKKRYLIALLCTIGLTVVIGMRSEMLGIITNLKNSSDHSQLIFKPSQHRKMPWKDPIMEDFVENAVFFSYLVASPIGGFLTVKHDSSLLLGCSVAMTCGINLFLPLVETLGNNLIPKITMIIFLRLLQGMAEGCLVPAVFGVLRFWCPKNEKSTILCLSVIGVSMGPLIGLPVCAEIEQKWGWGVVFYIYANIGLIWCIFWWRIVDERPENDRNLSKQERQYIFENSSFKSSFSKKSSASIPWKLIFSSKPVYAIFCTYAADDWTFQISSVCMQTYYLQMYKVRVEKTIYLLSFPFLARSIFVPIGGFLADFLKLKTTWSWTTIRKCLAGLGFGLKGIFFIALSFAKDEMSATILLSLALGFSGLAVAGYAVNVIDLAPNYAGLVMGFANSISTFTGILSTVIASFIVSKMSQGWKIALCMAAGIQLFSMQMYLLFASSEKQKWANPKEQTVEMEDISPELHLCHKIVIDAKSDEDFINLVNVQ